MADKIFLTLILISVLLGCNGNGNLRADQSISGGISSPELSVGEALVYIGNGAKQCENDGMSISESANLLINHGVDVISSHCGLIAGMAVLAVCGGPTLEINLHVINARKISDAQEEGFNLVSKLEEQRGVGYQVVECKK